MNAIRKICFGLFFPLLASSALPAHAGMNDDPFMAMFLAEKLEVVDDDDRTLQWDASFWAGKTWNRLWIDTEGEAAAGERASENRFMYSRPIAPFWDLQVGLGLDENPDARKGWLVAGINGLAPYWFETSAHLLVGRDGAVGLRTSASYEALLTQFLILTPELELDAYSRDVPDLGIGSGVANVSAGLRLRYEIRREFAPYAGVEWKRTYGNTADYLRNGGESASDTRFVAGLRIWY